MNRAIFLDRDGTLNYDSRDYIKNLSEFKLYPFTISALQILSSLGFKLVIISNQACIGKGLTTEEAVEEIHSFLRSELKSNGVILDGVYYCPHRKEDNCDCRKPAIGNVKRAAADFAIDLSQSYFIGDSPKDVLTGRNAGCCTIRVATGVWQDEPVEYSGAEIEPDYKSDNLLSAAQLIALLERGKE